MPNGCEEPGICSAPVGYTANPRHPMPGIVACERFLIASHDAGWRVSALH